MSVALPVVEAPATASSAHKTTQQQFDRVAERLGLDQATRELLRSPRRELQFLIPVQMDDGTRRVFRGIRVQHNDARGPFKGGVRLSPRGDVDDVRALAMWMTWKCAIADLDTRRIDEESISPDRRDERTRTRHASGRGVHDRRRARRGGKQAQGVGVT
jgi:hypothetical protein